MNSTPAPFDTHPTLIDYVRIIYLRRRTVYLVVFTCLIATAILSRVLPVTYQATAVIFFPFGMEGAAPNPSDASVDKVPPLPTWQVEIQRGILGILNSSSVLELVAAKVPSRSARQIRWNTDIDVDRNNMIKIDVRDRDPEVAAEIANAYHEAGNQLYERMTSDSLIKVKDYLAQGINESSNKLRQMEDRLQAFLSQNKIAPLEEEIATLMNRKATIESDINTTLVLIQQNERERESLELQLQKEGLLVLDSDILSFDNYLQRQKEDLTQLEGEIASEKHRLKPDHPRMIALKERKSSIEQAISNRVNQIISSAIKPTDMYYETLRKNLTANLIQAATLDARRETLAKLKDEADARMSNYLTLQAEYERLDLEITTLKEFLQDLNLQLEDAEVKSKHAVQYFIEVDRASAPETPVFPIMWINLLVAWIFGMVGGIFLALFLNYIDQVRAQKRVI